MVSDPEEIMASNSPWPFSKKKEILVAYSHRPKAKAIVKVILLAWYRNNIDL